MIVFLARYKCFHTLQQTFAACNMVHQPWSDQTQRLKKSTSVQFVNIFARCVRTSARTCACLRTATNEKIKNDLFILV